LWRRSVAQPG